MGFFIPHSFTGHIESKASTSDNSFWDYIRILWHHFSYVYSSTLKKSFAKKGKRNTTNLQMSFAPTLMTFLF